eukprot:SAG11_NODE_9125_length_940_cov_1.208086_2_plen_125_part_00
MAPSLIGRALTSLGIQAHYACVLHRCNAFLDVVWKAENFEWLHNCRELDWRLGAGTGVREGGTGGGHQGAGSGAQGAGLGAQGHRVDRLKEPVQPLVRDATRGSARSCAYWGLNIPRTYAQNRR